MVFDLVDGRDDLAVFQDILDVLIHKIAQANGAHFTGAEGLFQFGPGLAVAVHGPVQQ